MISEDLFEIRNDKIDDVESWYWLKSDNGAFDGPKNDWVSSHRSKILKYVKNFDVVVQAGGCLGMYPRLLSDMFKTVYTFEPHPRNFHGLVRNCNKENIIKINASLGDERKFISMTNGSDTNVGTYNTRPKEDSFIPQMMIDDLPLTKCDLIYLDVENYELHAIKGAVNTINKFRPIIFAENGNLCGDFLRLLNYLPVDQSVADIVFQPLEVFQNGTV